jgi:deazaflavin-dependent oxidoreductase (nitroreductase family)
MYQRPSWMQRHIANRVMRLFAGRFGRDLDGIWVLEVRGRMTGNWHATPVKPVQIQDQWYLVSLHGDGDWSRNLRHTPSARLRRGREIRSVEAEDLPASERAAALREYLRRASRQATRDILAGGQTTASEQHLREIAADHPVFRLRDHKS